MKIISHRGYWKQTSEKNTEHSFEQSFSLGFGTETDIRDHNGNLVISHDMPDDTCMGLDHFFSLVSKFGQGKRLPLALNIKADGLQDKLIQLLDRHTIQDYFLFDMSLPDLKVSIEKGLLVYSRLSEFEKEFPFYEQVKGIWLDAFYGTWYNADTISTQLAAGKTVCIVSAELHKRDHISHWEELKQMQFQPADNIILCTDFPETANLYFNHA